METGSKVCIVESPLEDSNIYAKCYIRMAFKTLACFVRFKLEVNPLNADCFHTEEVNNYIGFRG